MSPYVDDREFKQVLVSELNPPQLDARIDRDPEKLDQLRASLLRRGVIKPLAVVRDGERYEIVDGHRRYLAAKLADLIRVPCMVYATQDKALEGVKYEANAHTEEMSIADEAVFFHELYQHECGEDLEAVAAMVGKKLSYVDGRVQLLLGDEEVFNALRRRDINFTVATALNTIPDAQYRRYYLTHAIKGGATASVVHGWVQDWKRNFEDNAAPAPAPAAAPQVVATNDFDPHRCYLCGQNDKRYIPEQVSIHTHCRLAILDPLLAASRGEG